MAKEQSLQYRGRDRAEGGPPENGNPACSSAIRKRSEAGVSSSGASARDLGGDKMDEKDQTHEPNPAPAWHSRNPRAGASLKRR